jgi:peptidoglycan biosynthesis protein MviN/MurJ (putative lipid II flippase)
LDPTKTNPLYAALAYVHPAVATLGLLAALVVLSTGLRMRDARLKRHPSPSSSARRHVRLAPLTVAVLCVAFALGPLSAWLLRHWKVLDTVHGWSGLVTTVCFSAAALLGRRLRIAPGPRRSLHGNLGLLAMFGALVTVLTGIALLP